MIPILLVLLVAPPIKSELERPTRGLVAVDPARILLPIASAEVRRAAPVAFAWGAVGMAVVTLGKTGFLGVGAGLDHQSLQLHDDGEEAWAELVGFDLADVGQADVLLLGPRVRFGTVRRKVIGYGEIGPSGAVARIQGGSQVSYARAHGGPVNEYELAILGGAALFIRGGFDVLVWRGLTLGGSVGAHPTWLWPARGGPFSVHGFFAGLGVGWYV